MKSHRIPIEDVLAELRAEEDAHVPDSHGVPTNVFGVVPENFYGLIGRIAMLAPVVEKELHWLHDVITGATQDEVAGIPFGQLSSRCKTALAQGPPEVATIAIPAIDMAVVAAKRRNAIVHSLWPDPSLSRAIGHRPVRPKERAPGSSDWTLTISTDQDDLRSLIKAQIEAMDALADARRRISGL